MIYLFSKWPPSGISKLLPLKIPGKLVVQLKVGRILEFSLTHVQILRDTTFLQTLVEGLLLVSRAATQSLLVDLAKHYQLANISCHRFCTSTQSLAGRESLSQTSFALVFTPFYVMNLAVSLTGEEISYW